MSEKVDVEIIELKRRITKLESLVDTVNNVTTKGDHRIARLEETTLNLNETVLKNVEQVNQLISSMNRFNDMLTSANKTSDVVEEIRKDLVQITIQQAITQRDLDAMKSIPNELSKINESLVNFKSEVATFKTETSKDTVKNSIFTGSVAKGFWMIFGVAISIVISFLFTR